MAAMQAPKCKICSEKHWSPVCTSFETKSEAVAVVREAIGMPNVNIIDNVVKIPAGTVFDTHPAGYGYGKPPVTAEMLADARQIKALTERKRRGRPKSAESNAARKPWEKDGISERAWYRRQKKAETKA